MVTKPTGRPEGRPPYPYTNEIADEICETIAISHRGIDYLCQQNPHWPSRDIILRWRLNNPEFRTKYAEAKRQQIDTLIDDTLNIAYNSAQDADVNDNGKVVMNSEYVARSRLKIDTIKWLASKLAPKIYGDKIQSETTHIIKQEDAIRELE